MCSKQKIRKIAWCLLLVALISLIPTNNFKVLAEGDIVPPFPYDELQTIGENNYVLFRVHGVDQVDYIECIIPSKGLHGAFDSVLPGLSYSSLGGWVLQINSIDYYFKNGQSVYFDLQSLFTTSFMPVNNDDDYFPAWLEFVYCTSDVWGWDDDKISGYHLRFFKDQNFIIEPAATPTPTPTPDIHPIIKPWVEYDNTDEFSFVFKYYNNYYGVRLIDYPAVATLYYPYAYNIGTPADSKKHFLNSNLIIGIKNFSIYKYLNYHQVEYSEEDHDYYSLGLNTINLQSLDSQSANELEGVQTSNIGAWYWYYCFKYWNLSDIEIVATNHSIVPSSSDNPNISPTPLPTSAPTPIPQPSITPEPEDPDKNSSWGWGIVNTLKYIFIPDKNKLIRLEKTTQTKFQQFGGGYDDLKHVSGFEDPVRPQNVVMNWQPFGTDSAEQQQQITLVDFEQIDFYLFQTSSGMFICDCLKASFTFLMFGYLIHVIRKHFVIENNTSEESDGGGD